jgi:hypothetical protein
VNGGHLKPASHHLIFDYRGFGESEGTPRNVVDLNAQLDDYRSVIQPQNPLAVALPQADVLVGSAT